jgi:predicted regulator of Ras-like GTPase activity (Roadblock/LC7/MglB family)
MAFKTILKDLTTKVGATGAIMLDRQGEAVDRFSTSKELELDAIGAHKGVILNMLNDVARRRKNSGEVKSIGISTSNTRLAISPIKEGYYLLVAMDRKRPMGRAIFECKKAARKIAKEMG